MTRLFVFIAMFFCLELHAGPTLSQVRELYKRSVNEKASCMQLVQLLKGYNEINHPLFAGYRACATIVMAKHVFNPVSKYSFFSSGKMLLEKTIAADPSNTELIFLRFAIQTNLPSFLNYRRNISEDKAVLIRMAPLIKDSELKAVIISFMQRSPDVNDHEKQLMYLNHKKL